MTKIAIVGMACRYPDANSPDELWVNAVAGRRAFRRLPDERMNLNDYWASDPAASDKFYTRTAAVIEGYEFDRVAYKIAGSTFRSTDLTHWLALDVAAQALSDAGFPAGDGLPRERTGVIVGNSLTGEFSRASQLRLRWPFVRRTVAAALKQENWEDDRLQAFLASLETAYKAPFPAVDEDTLAGGLSNTIAGRICNHFDLKGGGYTVDGACSSSLLSVATGCKAVADGDIDVAVAGGVDLSIDPFEIVGFAKTGALARTEMRVYDRGANGFWPGEGCGMVVLMREDEARARGHRVIATIAGWGISSDGKGGITRPEVSGYQLALRRAYERAGFGIETVGLFEGHGTGTAVGDATELKALCNARRAAGATGTPAAISSIKAMIGHTKAAAGVAGLIKAAMAVHHQVLPPALGCVDPHEQLTAPDAMLRILRVAEPWPGKGPVRAGVTAMGFGGINTHIVLENKRRRASFNARSRALASSLQDAELLAVDAASSAELAARLDGLARFVSTVSYAQLGDLAATLQEELRNLPWRAAVVASSPEEAAVRLRAALEKVEAGETSSFSPDGRTMLGHVTSPGKLGFLFPGQGSGRGMSGGALRRRFAEAQALYAKAALPEGADAVATEVAQPRIVTGSLAGLHVLRALGLDAVVAVGHSLGEITALHWADAMDEDALLRIAALRGRTMSKHSASGTMAGLAASAAAVEEIVCDLSVVVAAYNSPGQTVVAGTAQAIEEACARATRAGIAATPLAVSHAFHSPLVAPAAEAFGKELAAETFKPLSHKIISTVIGDLLPAETDVPALLRAQITDPVLFQQALSVAAKDVDLFVEVGPGRVLSGLAAAADVHAVALDTDDESLAGVLRVVGAAFVVGAASVSRVLFRGRPIRPLTVSTTFSFFGNPCETAPAADLPPETPFEPEPAASASTTAQTQPSADAPAETALNLLRGLAAARAELPLELVHEDSRLLDGLHLSSITVGQIVNQVAAQLGVSAAHTPTNFATATVRELAETLQTLAQNTPDAPATQSVVAGAASWARPWAVDLVESPMPPRVAAEANGPWQVFAPAGHPFSEELRRALEQAGVGRGVVVCLPRDCTEAELDLPLRAAKLAISGATGDRFVLVQQGRGAAGLAKTLSLEAPRLRVTIVHLETDQDAVGRSAAEVAATARYAEVHYGSDGIRRVPTLRVLPYEGARSAPALCADDVILVTGGGKGITAECALAMAVDSGAKLALLGRSDPLADRELSANLRRIAQAGVVVEYVRADVTDAASVRRGVKQLRERLGPVTAVLHGAGRNEPQALSTLDNDAFRRTLAPKVDGLRAVLDAVDAQQVRLLVTLGSIIGQTGLRGEAHYATANEWLSWLTADHGRRHPHCRTLCLEWSVWSGVGMGERLSVVESLSRDGVTAISPDQGIAVLRRLLSDPDAPATVVISGRTQGIDTVRYDTPELPLLRFVERPLVRYHGVELVCEIDLSAGTDLYLADHLLDGNQLFPAVFGMEAMAQVASAAIGAESAPVVEGAEFLRPIVVPPRGSTRIRVAAVVTGPATVSAVVQSVETGYAADHFRARLHFGKHDVAQGKPEQVAVGVAAPSLDAAALYESLLFQGRRFQRLRRYHRAAARHVDAAVVADKATDWFAGYLPRTLLLGDPGVRDALMHGNQVCVPDATLLPESVERIVPAGNGMLRAKGLRFCAIERLREGDSYVYDIALRDQTGRAIERWEGLRLRAVRRTDGRGPWIPALLGPYLERSVGDALRAGLAVAIEPFDDAAADIEARRAHSAVVAAQALGEPTTLTYRPDGRPEVRDDRTVSLAHGAGVTMCVTGKGPLSCDVEAVAPRPRSVWQGLLGPHLELAQQIQRSSGEVFDAAATRVWAAMECLLKAGLPVRSALSLQSSTPAGWVVLACGELRVGTFITALAGQAETATFAILAGEG